MSGIFISYRQQDAKGWAILLRDDLAEVFGSDQVFLDRETLHAGNWREQLEHALNACRVVLVVIGARWLSVSDQEGKPRISRSDDVLRQEIALALGRPNLTVIPVLVDEASMPRADELPEDLRPLGLRQARAVGDTVERRKVDLAVLIQDIETIGGVARIPAAPTPPPAPAPAQPPARNSGLRTVIVAFALTVAAGTAAFLAGWKLGNPELLFVFVVLYAVAHLGRWLWARGGHKEGGH